MADNVSFEWDFSETINGIEQMGKDISKVEQRATLKAGQVVKAAVEKNLPKSEVDKEGYTHMKDDIRLSGLKEDEDGDKIREVYGGKETGYKWKFLEFGTSKMKGNQFMTKSVEETAEEVEKVINEELQKQLNL